MSAEAPKPRVIELAAYRRPRPEPPPPAPLVTPEPETPTATIPGRLSVAALWRCLAEAWRRWREAPR